jgi:hypothetical protein
MIERYGVRKPTVKQTEIKAMVAVPNLNIADDEVPNRIAIRRKAPETESLNSKSPIPGSP